MESDKKAPGFTADQQAQLHFFKKLRETNGEGLSPTERRLFQRHCELIDERAEKVTRASMLQEEVQARQREIQEINVDLTQIQGRLGELMDLLVEFGRGRGDIPALAEIKPPEEAKKSA